MPTLEDVRLGQLAVAQGLAQPLEVEECLSEINEYEEEGQYEALGELLVHKGYITRTQLNRLLSLQREACQKVTRIGNYDLIRKLGEGGMGAVYQAKDLASGQMVALKVLPRSRAKDRDFLRRFEAEVRAGFELDHPNIVRGLFFGHADGYHFLVMEYVDGRDVSALLDEKGRISEQETRQVLRQIASALDHIHGEMLVHRDIKPENIMIDNSGVAKLTDMGLAVDREVAGRRRITKAGIAMGTPFYLSPEQIQGKSEIDIRSDIYSLGTTIYEMLTGRPPFDDSTAAVVMMKHINEQAPSPNDIDRNISPTFCSILEKMMAKDPTERYQTPADLLHDLDLLDRGEQPRIRLASGHSSVARPSQENLRITGGQNVARRRNQNLDQLEHMIGEPSRARRGLITRERSALRPVPEPRLNYRWALLAGMGVAGLAALILILFHLFTRS